LQPYSQIEYQKIKPNKKAMDYYLVVYSSNEDEDFGTVTLPRDWDYYIFRSGNYVDEVEIPVLKMSKGRFEDYQSSLLILCSEKLKNIVELNKSPDDIIQWFSVKIDSEEYGILNYFILHFPNVPDVLNREKTIFNTYDPEYVIKPHFDLMKVRKYHIFTYYTESVHTWVVSEKMKSEIQKAGITGIDFAPLSVS